MLKYGVLVLLLISYIYIFNQRRKIMKFRSNRMLKNEYKKS